MATRDTAALSRTPGMKKRTQQPVQKKRPRDVKFASPERGAVRPTARPNTGQVRTDTKRAIASARSTGSGRGRT